MPPTAISSRRGRRSRAFTLIEVIVTLVIIATLLAVAMVGYTSVIGHSRDRATAIQLTQLYKDAAGTAAMRQEPVTLTDFQNAATEIPIQAAGAGHTGPVLAAGHWQVLDSTTPITEVGQVQVTTTMTEAGRVVAGLAALSRPGHCILVRGERMATVTTSVDGSCTETASGAATTLSASTGKLTAAAPAQMSAPTVTAGNTSLAVTWAPAIDGGAPVTGYTLTLTPATGAPVVKTATPDVTTLSVTGLTNGVSYSVTVVAANIVGTSAPSPAVVATPATKPDAPTNVTATAGDASVALTWQAPVNDGGSALTGYKVTANFGSGQSLTRTTDAATAQLNFTGLTNGVSYTFWVQAVNAVGASATATSAAVKPVSPIVAYPDAVMADGANGYWHLGEASGTFQAAAAGYGGSLTDYSYGNLSRARPSLVPSMTDKAVNFPKQDYYRLQSSARVGGPQMTVEMWVQCYGNSQVFFGMEGPTSMSDQVELYGYSGKWALIVQGTYYYLDNNVAMTATCDGQPHMLDVTLDSTSHAGKVYRDGAPIASTTFGSAVLRAAQFSIGGNWGAGGKYSTHAYAGTVDEVSVYPSVLSDTRIQAHYNAGLGQ